MPDRGQAPLTISVPAAEQFVMIGLGDGVVRTVPDHADGVAFAELSHIQRKVLEARLRALADLVADSEREEANTNA